jgi:hypothetical protein
MARVRPALVSTLSTLAHIAPTSTLQQLVCTHAYLHVPSDHDTSPSYFADKECVYTNAAGRLINAPRSLRPVGLPALPGVDGGSPDPCPLQDRPAASTSRKRARQDSDEPADDAHTHPGGVPGPASAPIDLPPIIGGGQLLPDDAPLLQPNLVHELVNRE